MPDPEVVELQDDGPDEPTSPRTEQHPALGGDTQAEIDARTPDGALPGEYVHTFIVDRVDIGDDDACHIPNKQVCAQEAINRGMHPRGEARLVSSTEVDLSRRHRATELTYAVKVVPSSTDAHPEETTTPAKQDTEPESTTAKKPARRTASKS